MSSYYINLDWGDLLFGLKRAAIGLKEALLVGLKKALLVLLKPSRQGSLRALGLKGVSPEMPYNVLVKH